MIKIQALKTILLVCCSTLLLFSCNNDDEWKSGTHELKVKPEGTSAMQNEPFEFTDLSLGIISRIWTFEDGLPATSTTPVVKVTFTKPGTKKYTLTLQYDNGTTETKEFTIDVKVPLKASIDIPSVTPLGCVKLNEPINFNANVTDNEVNYEWTFPGGIPATSNEKAPSVTWKTKNFVEVTLRVTRPNDGAELSLTKRIHAGPYPMLRTMSEYDTDSWGADAGTKVGSWIMWNGNGNIADQVMTRANEGANGTAHSIQINYNGQADWQFFPRDMWVANAKLKKGQKYEFSFYAKSSKAMHIGELILINAAYDYMYDAVAQALISTDWSKFYPNIPLTYQSSETRYVYDSSMEITNTWKQFRYEFTVGDKDITGATVPDILLNTYPFFVFTKADGAGNIYIDEIEINVLEDESPSSIIKD